MAARSRKRGRRPRAGARPGAPGRSERKSGEREPAGSQPLGGTPSRSEERNAAVRATLTPLSPGERPWPIKIAALIAMLVGVGDLVAVLAAGGHVKFGGTHASPGGVVLFSLLMIVCAVGMWQLRYWAVLGFQAILAFVILIFSLLLIKASNVLGLVVAVVVIGGGGLLFYKLVRVLSRIQMPTRQGRPRP